MGFVYDGLSRRRRGQDELIPHERVGVGPYWAPVGTDQGLHRREAINVDPNRVTNWSKTSKIPQPCRRNIGYFPTTYP
jgi:hypothetical protein